MTGAPDAPPADMAEREERMRFFLRAAFADAFDMEARAANPSEAAGPVFARAARRLRRTLDTMLPPAAGTGGCRA